MRQFFAPANAPLWLRAMLGSIRDGLSDVWNTAIRLKDYTTANLPPAADWKQGLVYDSTLNSPHYSNGTSWVRLSDYDADVAAIAALTTTGLIARTGAGTAATRTITGTANEITVVNGDGVAGNPTLALANPLTTPGAATITGTLTVGTTNHATATNLQIGGATIAALGATGLSVTGAGTFSSVIKSTRASASVALPSFEAVDGAVDVVFGASSGGLFGFFGTYSAHDTIFVHTQAEKARVTSTGLSVTGNVSASTRFDLPSYTVAGLPAVGAAGGMIYVSNEVGGAVPAFSDGTNWRRVTDRAIVA